MKSLQNGRLRGYIPLPDEKLLYEEGSPWFFGHVHVTSYRICVRSGFFGRDKQMILLPHIVAVDLGADQALILRLEYGEKITLKHLSNPQLVRELVRPFAKLLRQC
ncbi:MAG: hypothetical protein HY075_10340 [Deltaproteobacteria bacterium]|nr:hypothetical protein [Deltaproteobacteria bacterium]